MIKLVIHGRNNEIGNQRLTTTEATNILRLLKEVDNFSYKGIILAYAESTCDLSEDAAESTTVRIFGDEGEDNE